MKAARYAWRLTGMLIFAAGIYLLLCAPGFLSDASSNFPVSSADSP
jgi:hypothetical protein